MGSGAVEVELGRLLRVLAAEVYVAVAAAYVECLLVAQGICLVAYLDNAFALAYVEYADLAACSEVFGLERVDGFELEFFVDGHCAAYNHAVVH